MGGEDTKTPPSLGVFEESPQAPLNPWGVPPSPNPATPPDEVCGAQGALEGQDLLQEGLGGRGDPVGELDLELDDEVPALVGGAGVGQPLPRDAPLHPRLQHVLENHRDGAAVQRGDGHCAATQGLAGGMGGDTSPPS